MSAFAVQNALNQYLVNAGNVGLTNTLAANVPGSLRHTSEKGLIHTTFDFNADFSFLIGATGARCNGIKIFDFPILRVIPLASRLQLAGLAYSEAGASSTAGEIGLGSVIGSGAVAVLGGTATFEDYLEGGLPALGNIAAAATLARYATGDGSRADIGNMTVAPSLFLNLATTMAGATAACNAVIKAGSKAELWWIPILP